MLRIQNEKTIVKPSNLTLCRVAPKDLPIQQCAATMEVKLKIYTSKSFPFQFPLNQAGGGGQNTKRMLYVRPCAAAAGISQFLSRPGFTNICPACRDIECQAVCVFVCAVLTYKNVQAVNTMCDIVYMSTT